MKTDILFVEAFFKELKRQDIKYCILRNADEVECGDAHDIDMTVDKSSLKKAENILMSIAKEKDWKLHIKTGSAKDRFNIKCYHFFTVTEAQKKKDIHIVHFDIYPTFTWKGYILLNNDALIQGIDESTVYHRADPAIEAVTKLFIRLLHNGYIKTKYKDYIKSIFDTSGEKVKTILKCFLSEEQSEEILDIVKKEKWRILEESRNKIIADIKRNAKSNRFGQKLYLMKKSFNKAGIMVAFEGTDGSGKSTIINALPAVLGNSFPETMQDYYHWRPGFLKKEKRDKNRQSIVVTEPHAKKPYGRIKSFLKFTYFNLDYILGYWFKLRWQISKGHLVIFDRYYYDYYLDKRRYRLTISDTVLDLFKFFIPKPDVTFLLVGNPQTLYERKKEISVNEIQIQIDILLKNKNKFNHPSIVDVNNSIDDVVYDVSKRILEVSTSKIKR